MKLQYHATFLSLNVSDFLNISDLLSHLPYATYILNALSKSAIISLISILCIFVIIYAKWDSVRSWNNKNIRLIFVIVIFPQLYSKYCITETVYISYPICRIPKLYRPIFCKFQSLFNKFTRDYLLLAMI